MKTLFLVLLLLSSMCFGGMWDNDYTFPISLITSAQNMTSVWTDVGDPVKVNGFKRVGLDVDLDINDSNNARLRWVRQATSGGADRLQVIETIGATDIKIDDKYFEFNVDADQVVSIDFDIFPIQYIQLQTSVGTESTIKGQLDAVKYYLFRE